MALPVVGFRNIAQTAISHYSSGRHNKRAIMVLGPPGGGKTALGWHIANELGYKREEVMVEHPSLRTPLDYVGVPRVVDGMTVFNPPDYMHKLTTGEIKFLILDELPDAVASVQNVLCGLVYDYAVAGLRIHPDLNIFITGNRVEDRSGANRVITKFANRVKQYELAKSVPDLIDHAIDADWDKDVVAYLHWRGEDAVYGEGGFDPTAPINNSPRQWEEVCFVDQSLPHHLYLNDVKSLIQEGTAEDFMGFKRTVAELPPINEVLTNPEHAPVSDKIDVCYALTSRLITEVDTVMKYQKLMAYVTRMRVEVQTLFINTVRKRVPEVRQTPEYTQWCVKNQAYFGAGQ